MPKRGNAEARQINPGDVGIWATCAMKKEAPTVADLRDLFQGVRFYRRMVKCTTCFHKPGLIDRKYATKLYGDQAANGTDGGEEEDSDVVGDIEAEINKELSDIRKPAVKPIFTSVKLDTQCCK